MLVLDTTDLPASDRAEVFQSTVSANCTASLAGFDAPHQLRAELHTFHLGAAEVFTIEATGTTLRRTPRLARAMNESPICLALPIRTTDHLIRSRDERTFGASDLMLVDLTAPYVYGWPRQGRRTPSTSTTTISASRWTWFTLPPQSCAGVRCKPSFATT